MSTERIESYLCGRWVSGAGDGVPLVNPATEEVLATASTTGLDLAAALAHAREEGGRALRGMSFAERGELLGRMSAALHESRETLIASSVENGGCTRSDAKFDIDGAIHVLAAYAEIGRSLGGGRILADGDGIQLGRSPRFWGQHVFVSRRGAAVLINAFNFPAWGFAEKAACALLAGVPVLTKPATATALTAARSTRILVEQAGLPEGALAFVGGSLGAMLDHLDGQDVLAFTGSAATAAALRAHPGVVSESVTVNVEADSLNAAVLGPDVEPGSEAWDLFLRDVVREMTQKTGQKCTAVRRLLLPGARAGEAIDALGSRLSEITLGDPALKEVRMGPLATRDQLRDVRDGVRALREEADPVFGDPDAALAPLGAPKGKGYFHGALLLRARDAAAAKRVHELEVFGPVATILPYSGGADEAVDLVRRGKGGLVSSVYTDDRDFAEAMTLELAPYHGRLYLGSSKVAEYAMGSGIVLPECVHGGPGRAGGGEELGGLRGVHRYMHRTVVQGARPIVERITGTHP